MHSGKALIAFLLFAVLGISYASNRSKIFNALREVDPPNKYPFLGWILIGTRRVKCGAVLVAPNAAVTAASCASADIVGLTFGDHSRSDANRNEQVFTVANTIVHPSFSPSTFEYDIAVLELNPSITETAEVAPIPLLPNDAISSKVLLKHMRVAGWGYEVAGASDSVSDQSDVPLEFTVDVSGCTDQSAPNITGECYTPYRDPSSFVCEGDTGGPLFVKRKGIFTLAGVLSGWNVGEGCTSGERIALLIPAVYDWLTTELAAL